MTVTHRIIDIRQVNGEYEYVTKGDNNPTSDSDTAKYANVIGRVYMRIPQLGRVQFFLATRMGWFIVVLLPAMGGIIYDLIKLAKLIYSKKSADKIENVTTTESQEIKENIASAKEMDEVLEKLKKSNYVDRLKSLKNFENNDNTKTQ